LGLLWLVVGAVIAWAGWAGMTGRLPRQHWAGIRLPSTMRSDQTWRAAHRAGGPWLAAGGLVSVIGGVGLLLVRPTAAVASQVSLVLVGALLVLVLLGGTVGVRAARRVDPGPG
jgi:uncharacterized membrane protein